MMKRWKWPLALALVPALLLLVACSDIAEIPTDVEVATEDALLEALRAPPAGDKVRLIVKLQDMDRARGLAATFGDHQAKGNGRVLRTYDNFPLLTIEVSANAVEALRRAPGVLALTPDVPEPPTLDDSLGIINADQVHVLGFDGSGFTIAILDTGIDQAHPFFGDRIVSQACYSTGGQGHDPDNGLVSLCPGNANSSTAAGSADTNITACDNNGDFCDHGTHVAGIAAGNGTGVAVTNAQAAGVAPAANIIAIQVFTRFTTAELCDPNNTPPDPASAPCIRTYPSDQIAGLDRVFTLRNDFDIVAANMSLGSGNFTASCDVAEATRKTAIDTLLGANIATTISSGNNNIDNAVGAPACISTAVTVGATDKSDNVTRNRGPLLDLFAPGSNIWSSGSKGGFEQKGGTSMAAPHVAGAWAVLRQVYPGASVSTILQLLQDTGVPITYTSDGNQVTTQRIDLLAAVQASADPPTLTADAVSVTVDEGQTATNTGTFAADAPPVSLSASVGTVIDAGGGAWSWSFPTVDGPSQTQTVTITATDSLAQEGEVTFDLIVENVAPTVTIDLAQITSIDEGDTLLVTAHFTDPGTLDTHTATITCHDVGGPQTVAGSIGNVAIVGGVLTGTVTASCTYGDASYPTFEVTVSVVDSDGDVGDASFHLTVANVDPTVAIGTAGATLVNGVPVFIGQIGQPLTFDADVTDPGSDDLDLLWDWDDGSTSSALYLLNPPNPDPKPSPDVAPRNVFDSQTNTWTDACLYLITLTATDDDGGVGSDEANVVIAGNAGRARSLGYWQTEYRGRTGVFDDATLNCYLAIAGLMSAVFDEVVDASTIQKAANVLHPRGRPSMRELLDAQLLAAWLNFANGAFAWDELVDTTGNKIPDTAFATAVATAESVRLDPSATGANLEAQKNILERINTMHE
jgi:subtilisin family serine protease